MNKEKLNSYYWLLHEIASQENRKERLKKRINQGGLATDIVKGSSSQFPYIETKIKITGVPTGLLSNIEAAIEKNIEQSVIARAEIENFINKVEDPRLRELLRSRFIDCLIWKEVGEKNYIAPDHARKIVREFLSTLE